MTSAAIASLRRSSVVSPDLVEGKDSDAYLFDTPADLLCPITHELFYEPVINAAGQVYERAALEKALAHRLVDPISNVPLETTVLTTVWPMKSKAAAYRERAVRGCVEKLCKPTCRSPIRYLRRAAELSAGMVSSVDASGALLGLPGLTPDVIEYLLTHPSSIYDFQALSRYASSLASGGYRDLAAGVYTKLLHVGGDSQQQVEALKGLLGCWGSPEEEEQKLVEKLAALSCGEGHDGCRPARFVGVLMEAGLPEELVLCFCEYILSGSGATHGSTAGGGICLSSWHTCSSMEKCGTVALGPAMGSVSASASGTCGYTDLLFVYTKLRCGRLEAALAQRHGMPIGTPAGNWTELDREPVCIAGAHEETVRYTEGGAGQGGDRAKRARRRQQVQRAI
ncbi:hypothetical protein VaNZ11_003657, partial [Volvox africanus]